MRMKSNLISLTNGNDPLESDFDYLARKKKAFRVPGFSHNYKTLALDPNKEVLSSLITYLLKQRDCKKITNDQFIEVMKVILSEVIEKELTNRLLNVVKEISNGISSVVEAKVNKDLKKFLAEVNSV